MSALNKCYSLDDEEFNARSMGDLIDNSSRSLEVGDVYYEADCKPLEPSDVVFVENILEGMDQQAYDEIGEVYDGECCDVTQEAKDELAALLVAWVVKNVNPLGNYWKIVGKSRECTFTAEDLA